MSGEPGRPAAPAGRPCPICGKPAQPRFRPFCSRRCADIDLGRWLGEVYRIPAGDAEGGDDEGSPADGEQE